MAQWTNEDINYLIQNSKHMTIDSLAKKLNRSHVAIYKKCLKLN
jgi:predicted transcriptional regulator